MRYILALLLCFAFSGCYKTVYVPAGAPVKLRETIRNVKVWVVDDKGDIVPGRIDIKEGWVAMYREKGLRRGD